MATAAAAVAGLPGGIFAPSLAVGAGASNLLRALFPGEPASAVVILGMVAYFAGAVRPSLTAVIILSETTASRGLMLPMFATAFIAEAASQRICREKPYHGLSRTFAMNSRSRPTADGAGLAPGAAPHPRPMPPERGDDPRHTTARSAANRPHGHQDHAKTCRIDTGQPRSAQANRQGAADRIRFG